MAFGAILTVNSCTKDTELSENDNGLQLREDRNQVHYFEPNDTVKPIILGEKITKNAFTVENMTIAWNILYPDCRVTRLNPTDIYTKFEPTSAEQVYELKKDINLTLFDFPLDYRVVQMGDYYDDPGSGEFPNFYGIVGSQQSMPANVGREVLSELYLDDSDPLLNAVAMINDGYPMDVISDYIGPIDRSDIDDCASIVLPPIIDCDPPCVPMLRIRDDVPPVNGKPQMEWYCDCSGGDPGTGGGDGDPGQYTTNGCGCKVFKDKLKPGGCVTVWDENLHENVGVRNAKIIVKNTSGYDFDYLWTWVRTTFTDENGCWKIDRRCSKRNNIHVWVEFNNEKAYIRGPHFDLKRYIIPVAHYVGEIDGPIYNNISVHYPVWDVPETQVVQRYWASAIIINTIDQMHINCANEGINVPPHLDIYHENQNIGDAAWMAHYGGLLTNVYATILGWGPSVKFLPDILLNRGMATDILRGVAFHEFTHGSHFTNVGVGWYNVLTLTEFEAEGHGNGTEPGAGYVAVAESWADHIGELFDDGNPEVSTRCENLVLEGNGFVPEGIHYDLFDQGVEPWNTGITDNISGFTNEMIFNTLNSQVTSIPQLETRLWNNYSTAPGVNASQLNYNVLFNSYGY